MQSPDQREKNTHQTFTNCKHGLTIILNNNLRGWMRQRKPISQRKRKADSTDGSQEEAVAEAKDGLIATHAERLTAKRNAKHAEDKRVKPDQSIHHADQRQHLAEHQEKERIGERQRKSLTIL